MTTITVYGNGRICHFCKSKIRKNQIVFINDLGELFCTHDCRKFWLDSLIAGKTVEEEIKEAKGTK